MATSLIPDPFQMWRDALTKLEGNVNALVTGGMDSQELMRSVHQVSTLSLGLQQAVEKAIGGYLAKVNLPSRKDVSELAAALQRVEEKLDRLLPASAPTAAPRPPRTRRPPPEDAIPPAPALATPTRASSEPLIVEPAVSAPATRARQTRAATARAPAARAPAKPAPPKSARAKPSRAEPAPATKRSAPRTRGRS